MSGISGIVTGTLALAALEAVITTKNGNRLTEITAVPGAAARWFIGLGPLIPDVRSAATKTQEGLIQAAYKTAAANASAPATAVPATSSTPSPTTIPQPSNNLLYL